MIASNKKKLIEVAIPLEAINAASVREKSIRHGHPSTLHLWWARRPLAACRAVLFAQLVNDPSSLPDEFPTAQAQETERKRLFAIIKDLVKWENSTNEAVLERARAEIRKSCGDEVPPVYDPFSGGGSIPLEAQRLGLPAYGSDLNPVAVMIGKAMIEIPPKFKDMEPIHPGIKNWSFYRNAEGLAEDVKHYGAWMREKAVERIGHLYPQVDLPGEYGGGKATVIAWIWARTVPSPDPAFSGVQVPTASSFLLSSKKGKEAWIEPVVDKAAKTIAYRIRHGGTTEELATAKAGTKVGRGANFCCILSDTAITPDYIKAKGKAGEMEQALIAIVAEGKRGRVYAAPDEQHIQTAFEKENYTIANKCRDLFLSGPTPERLSDVQNSLCMWETSKTQVRHMFTRQAIPMMWDFGENNVFNDAAGDFRTSLKSIVRVLERFVSSVPGTETQQDAQGIAYPQGAVISTDPPYYDNIGYADLSDFFYIWLRRTNKSVFPDLTAVLAVPKAEELIATPYRHGGKDAAESFFLDGMSRAIANMAQQSSDEYPATIYYAFKQSEIKDEGISSTGWATFLQAVVEAGFAVVGTWPLRTEMANRMIASGTNALANSVVLVCRKKAETAEVIGRAEFIRALKRELPPAIGELQAANIAPADMPQSAIGPGMGVFSRYKAVLESDDSPMTVKTALRLINAELDEFLNDLQGEFDAETRFAATWFEQHGNDNGDYGVADNFARPRGISVESVRHAGKVRILKRDELDPEWDPATDDHLTVWECGQHLIRTLENDGEYAAAVLLKKIGGDRAGMVKDLAYYLYDVCSTKRQDAEEAMSYNGLIAVWSDLTRMAATIHDTRSDAQAELEL